MGRIEKTGMYTVNPNKRLPVGEKTSKEIVIIYASLRQLGDYNPYKIVAVGSSPARSTK